MTIDLRSDTLTKPDAAMRRAMANAEVGDDVFGEDPTVRRLEERAAALLGKEAALFVPSGTMGNQIAIHLHTSPGDEVLTERRAHIVNYEMGAMAALSGVQPRLVPCRSLLLEPDAVEATVHLEVPYQSRTTLLAVENTHNLGGGEAYALAEIEALTTLAARLGLRSHLDGARLFNAATAIGADAASIAAGFDSVTFCLSKGLGAPVGSVLCGCSDWIVEARRVRKMLGGGMRQVGVLAAAGLVALEVGPARLALDHEHAERLAAVVTECGLELAPVRHRTNIVICSTAPGRAPAVSSALAGEGVLAIAMDADTLRFVTHRDVSARQVEEACAILRRVLT